MPPHKSLVNRPLTFSDSFLICPLYCCKQLLVLSILSDGGSKVSDQSELSDLISPSRLTEQYPISGIVVFVFLLTELPVVVFHLTGLGQSGVVPGMTVTSVHHGICSVRIHPSCVN